MSSDAIEADAVGYEEDLFLWTQQQARRLRQRNDPGIDWENIAEEIESLGRRDRREVDGRLGTLLLHLLKWRYQPDERKGGWQASIGLQRDELLDIVRDSPSLRRRPGERLDELYLRARRNAADEMRLVDVSRLPERCPFTIDEMLDPDFHPEEDLRD